MLLCGSLGSTGAIKTPLRYGFMASMKRSRYKDVTNSLPAEPAKTRGTASRKPGRYYFPAACWARSRSWALKAEYPNIALKS